MVYYYTSTVVDPPAFVYVGKDKFESEPQHASGTNYIPPPCHITKENTTDEELIKHGWDEDVWLVEYPPVKGVDLLTITYRV
jgi:hypothetical protein